MKIQGTHVVITGAGSGMGAMTASYLSERGAKVAVLDLNFQAAKNIASEIKGLAIECDVTNEEDAEQKLEKLATEWGNPEVLINCAGIAPAQRILGREGPHSLSLFRKVIEVNLIGTFNMLRLSAAFMAKNKPSVDSEERGVIINTASIAAYEGQIGQGAYSASKGGVCALTLPAARELAKFGIRVMTIAPGLIQTPLFEGLSQEVREGLAKEVPFPHRLGKASEFASLAAHIIENPYLNGEIIRLDGALRMRAT